MDGENYFTISLKRSLTSKQRQRDTWGRERGKLISNQIRQELKFQFQFPPIFPSNRRVIDEENQWKLEQSSRTSIERKFWRITTFSRDSLTSDKSLHSSHSKIAQLFLNPNQFRWISICLAVKAKSNKISIFKLNFSDFLLNLFLSCAKKFPKILCEN